MGTAIVGDPGLAGRVEQRGLGVFVFSYLLWKDLPVPAEGYCVDTGASCQSWLLGETGCRK